MTCAVLSIGTELTRGELVNTNAAWLSARLTEMGFEVTEHDVVDDEMERIVATLHRVAAQSKIIVCTGGLGPTTDDLTSEAAARALGVELVRDDASFDHIQRRLERFGRTVSPSNAKQADFPKDASILPNPVGTAPGFEIALGGARIFFMPGVPSEMKKMFDDHVAPRIRDDSPMSSHQIRFRTFGLPESVVGERLAGVEQAFPGVTIGYRAHMPEIEVKVLARITGDEGATARERNIEARELAQRAAMEVKSRLNDVIYGDEHDTFAGVIGRELRNRSMTLAIAESCTGGLVGHLLTRESGASQFLLLDAVTYANSAKRAVLGVDEDVLRAYGAVSVEVARQMAEGARRVAGADIALAITGIAGPNGGSETKPVGLVYLAVSTARGIETSEHRFGGDRHQVQTLAAYAGLAMIRKACASAPPPPSSMVLPPSE